MTPLFWSILLPGMSEAATATTNSAGRYSIAAPGTGPTIGVNHQGGTYFIAAPQGDTPGDAMSTTLPRRSMA